MHAIARELTAQHEGLRSGLSLGLGLALQVLSWLIPIAFVVWAARLTFLEGYLYEIDKDFLGDFTRTAALGAPTWWTGQGIFYGPIFVLEYRFLLEPGLLSGVDFARLDFVLFGLAFACVWLALIGRRRPRLLIFALAAWLANHASVEAFANTAHLEVLELLFICLAILLAVREIDLGAGASLGLAIATKTLPGLFLPYLAITRRWRMLFGACFLFGALFLVVCAIQRISPWDGLYSLVYQGGNLTKLEYSEYEYTPRAEIARLLAGPGGVVSAEQGQLAIGLHWVIALGVIAVVAWVLLRARVGPRTYGLLFGLVAAAMLVVAPSAHPSYYIFLLPGWTAILAELLRRPALAETLAHWVGLLTAYVFVGFDQPFFLAHRLFGIGLVVPENWLAWHLPSLGLLITLTSLAVLVLTVERKSSYARRVARFR
jgi:hypothetical protein